MLPGQNHKRRGSWLLSLFSFASWSISSWQAAKKSPHNVPTHSPFSNTIRLALLGHTNPAGGRKNASHGVGGTTRILAKAVSWCQERRRLRKQWTGSLLGTLKFGDMAARAIYLVGQSSTNSDWASVVCWVLCYLSTVEVLLFRYGETDRSEEEARHATQGHTGKQRGQSGGREDKRKVGKNLYYGFRWGKKKTRESKQA